MISFSASCSRRMWTKLKLYDGDVDDLGEHPMKILGEVILQDYYSQNEYAEEEYAGHCR